MLAQKEAKQVSSSDCSAKDVKGSVSMKPCHSFPLSPLQIDPYHPPHCPLQNKTEIFKKLHNK